jgi:hypothetical protein
MSTTRRIVCGLVIALTVALALPAAAQEPIGRVERQQGVVTVQRAGVPSALSIGALVYMGDSLTTGPRSRIRLVFEDGSTLAVGPDTHVTLDAQRVGAGGSLRGVFNLLRGIVRTVLSADQTGGNVSVFTRAAIASVRSTDWIVEAEAGHTAVFVVDGAVNVRSTQDITAGVVLGPGDGTDVDVGEAPTPPVQWGAPRRADVLARTRL